MVPENKQYKRVQHCIFISFRIIYIGREREIFPYTYRPSHPSYVQFFFSTVLYSLYVIRHTHAKFDEREKFFV